MVIENKLFEVKNISFSYNDDEILYTDMQRMGYSYHEMSIAMHVKEETVRRNIYRICSHLKLDNAKLKFPCFIADY